MYARFTAHDSTWRPWGQLGYSVRTGMPAFDQIFGEPIFGYCDDDSATRLLQSCYRALGPRGKVLIVDPVVPAGNVPHYGKLLDLEMLVLTPRGRERTKTEFAALLRGAGFRLSRIVGTKSPLSVVEGVKA